MNMVIIQSQAQQNSPLFPPYLGTKKPPFPGLINPENTSVETLTLNNRKSTEDDEIGVFRAEKYFNGPIIDEDANSTTSSRASSHRFIISAQPNLEIVKTRIQPRTPSTVRSSESSWNNNSQSFLLKNNETLPKSNNNNNSFATGKWLLKSFRCKCSDKNSVETKEYYNNNYSGGEISFSKKSVNDIYIDSHKMVLDRNVNIPIMKPRSFRSEKSPSFRKIQSPDVFGSSATINASKTMSLERRLSMMSWDRPVAAPEEIVLSSTESADVDGGFVVGVGGNHETNCTTTQDSDSDASSDLFEIDSLTGKTNNFRSSNNKLRRPSAELHQSTTEETLSGCATPTTGYAPSEASIQWSVVTASQADFDDDHANAAPRRSSATAQRRRAMLGCKSHKSVSVIDSPARFQAEMARINNNQHSPSFPRLLPSPSPRSNSHLVYIK